MDNHPAPYFFTPKIFEILNNALDWGMTELVFWDMTLAELTRFFESKQRVQKFREQEKAYFDYTLANLIGMSIARALNKQNQMPEIEDVYPNIFDKKAKVERQDELSAARFRQFAAAFNNNFRKEDANG